MKKCFRYNFLLRILMLAGLLLTGLFFAARHTWADAGQRTPNSIATHSDTIDDGGSDGDSGDEEIHGLLVSAPQPPEQLGAWVIETEQNRTITVTADGQTRFDPPIPTVDSWVRALVVRQQDGTLRARRIRADDSEENEVVIRLYPNKVTSATIMSRYNLKLLSPLLASAHIYLFTSSSNNDDVEDKLEQMNADSDIEWVELNYVGHTPTGNPFRLWHWGGIDSLGYTNQNAFVQVNLASAQPSYQGYGQIIAVLDTGVAYTHTQLLGHTINGWDMVTDDNDPQEEGAGFAWGHGTHIAGIIAQIAPQSKIMPIRVLDSSGRGNTFTLAYAIEWATRQGADVINLSLGTSANSRVLERAVADAIAQGVVIVAAAGNEGVSKPQYPAAYADVISVVAVDSANIKANFSNYGTGWVDIAAPGVGITSTIIGAQGIGFASWSGTSMATGFVSGAAALVNEKSQKFPPEMSPDDIRDQLRNSAQNIDGSNPSYIGQLGGLLNIGAALEMPVGGGDTPAPTATNTTSIPTPQAGTATTVSITATPTPTSNGTPKPATATPIQSPSAFNKKVYLPVVER